MGKAHVRLTPTAPSDASPSGCLMQSFSYMGEGRGRGGGVWGGGGD